MRRLDVSMPNNSPPPSVLPAFVYSGEPERLDRVVLRALEGVRLCSRSQVERWIEQGCVQVNRAVVVRPGVKLRGGEEISVHLPPEAPSTLQPLELPLQILFEDAALLVVNKPAGLTMHPGAGNLSHTLANAVVQHVGAAQGGVGASDRPGIVHRLDKDTTGIVVVAKSTAVLAALARQFAERTVERSYLALVSTTPRGARVVQQQEQGEVSAPIGRHPTRRTVMAIRAEGRPAVTGWRVLERFSYATLVECRLRTGRTHQIRVHMQSIGCPIVGDPVYGGDASLLPQRLRGVVEGFARQALHAATLGFTHPLTAERLSFAAPPPQDLQQLIEAFR